MSTVAEAEHQTLASRLRDILAIYEKNLDLISIGAYKSGTNPRLDYAVSKIEGVNQFLRQGINESFTMEETIQTLADILRE